MTKLLVVARLIALAWRSLTSRSIPQLWRDYQWACRQDPAQLDQYLHIQLELTKTEAEALAAKLRAVLDK